MSCSARGMRQVYITGVLYFNFIVIFAFAFTGFVAFVSVIRIVGSILYQVCTRARRWTRCSRHRTSNGRSSDCSCI